MSAIKPNFIQIPALEAEKRKKKGVSTEEQQLYTLSKSAGWKIMVKYAENTQKDLEAVNREAISSGATFEEIGKNALVINMAQDIIRRLLNKVTDAVDACNEKE